jgi:hypothetical protein
MAADRVEKGLVPAFLVVVAPGAALGGHLGHAVASLLPLLGMLAWGWWDRRRTRRERARLQDGQGRADPRRLDLGGR